MKSNLPLVEKFFPCKNCGASLRYSIKTGNLKCPYCGYENRIKEVDADLKEYSFKEALRVLEKTKFLPLKEHDAKCPSCGAVFKIEENLFSGKCPYCGTFVVEEVRDFRPIFAKSLIPFLIDRKKAFLIFKKWIKSLWFAPSKLKNSSFELKFIGYYLPYWTFDSDTKTYYEGRRGDYYFEDETFFVNEGGRLIEKRGSVQKIRWRFVSGWVFRRFDDVVVGASKRLPRKIIDSLSPWPFEKAVGYDEKYISGFKGEIYQIGLKDGFEIAKLYMNQVIREDVRRDIGGDRQEILHLSTIYENKTFKHLLLPVWIADFKYENKNYRFAINAATGKIKGERPYSKWKIFFTVITILVLVAALFYLGDKYGYLFEEARRASSPYY